jgi:N-acetylneuraminic acid mutarotase
VFEGSPWDYGELVAELYDPSTGHWSNAGEFNLFWAPTVTLLQNGKVLVTGLYGSNHPTNAVLYDTYTGTWSTTGNLSTFRHFGGYSATLLADGKLLVAGGFHYYSNQPVSAEELYDPTTGNWTRISRLIRGRDSHTATLLGNGKVLVTGGLEGVLGVCNTSLGRAELYEPGDEMSREGIP